MGGYFWEKNGKSWTKFGKSRAKFGKSWTKNGKMRGENQLFLWFFNVLFIVFFNTQISQDGRRGHRDTQRKEDNIIIHKRKWVKNGPGILNWGLEGLARLRKRGYISEPAESIEMRTQSKEIGSNIIAFKNLGCKMGEGLYTEPDAMYDAFKRWCEADGSQPMKKRIFGRNLMRRFRSMSAVSTGSRKKRIRCGCGVLSRMRFIRISSYFNL
jgi:phage/plasmid-associated DNA primase